MEIVSSCLARDLPVYKVACESLRRHIPGARLHAVTRREDFAKFKDACGSDLTVWDEDTLIPEMTLGALRKFQLPCFPRGAGWYFQQFLKLAFERVSNDDSHFLIWDADTVLLRPIEFVDGMGRSVFVKADEYHRPYFETFEALFGYPAEREYSFISQHLVVEKSVLRSMLREITGSQLQNLHWTWAIMNQLRGEGGNLFSEYETYGHYLKHSHPERLVARELPWTRMGVKLAGYPPTQRKLERLAGDYAFAAFEIAHTAHRRILGPLVEYYRIFRGS